MDLNRYSVIEKGLKREMLLLKGTGCRWRKCTFCDYYLDYDSSPFLFNKGILDKVSGVYGALDIINSGSCFEYDDETLNYIRSIVEKKNIKVLWLECHYMYKDRLKEMASFFPCSVKFRCGVETFNPALRSLWNKGIAESVTAEDIARYFNGVCLLCGIKGQSKSDIISDIETAEKYFEYYSVNLFCKNSRSVEIDEDLRRFVINEVPNLIKASNKAELLINNTDLGVG